VPASSYGRAIRRFTSRFAVTSRTLARNLRALGEGNDLVARLELAERTCADQARLVQQAEQIGRTLIDRHYGGWEAPPAELRLHVGANDTLVNFWAKGLASSEAVVRVFGTEPEGPVLDWGCGSGRTLLWLRCYDAWQKMYAGCDVDAEAVGWLQSRGVDNVQVCGDLPPLPYPDATFAGLFGFSVLTHISPDRHRTWYEEFVRILRPGGVVYVTTHSAREADRATAEARQDFERAGAAFSVNPRPNHYKDSAIVTEAFTRSAVEGMLEVERYEPGGYAGQDGWLLRRPAR
jgi:SAM-dependent methyltransferase